MTRMQSIVINQSMEVLHFHNNKDPMYLLLCNLRPHLLHRIHYMLIQLYNRGYQPPVMQNQEQTPTVGYRPPLFPGSAELAEVVPEPIEEEPEKKNVLITNIHNE